MTQLIATSTYITNITDLAHQIDCIAGDVLISGTIGLYEAGNCNPIMVPNQKYYRRQATGRVLRAQPTLRNPAPKDVVEMSDVFVQWDTPIVSDVYNLDGQVVAYAKRKARYSSTSTIPTTSLRMIQDIVAYVIANHSNIYPSEAASKREVILRYLRSEIKYLLNINSETSLETQAGQIYLLNLVDTMSDMMMELENDLKEFLGQDYWHVFVANHKGTDIVIHRTIDYRIHVWEAEHGESFRRNAGAKVIR